jgi:cystathionine beta-synthase
MSYQKNILDFVGNTPIVKINRAVAGFNIFAKLEYLNPSGSTKDRIVGYILEKARREGFLNDDTTIVEATSGNTGIAVATYAAAKGLKSILVISDKMSNDKIDTIRALGSKVIVVSANVAADDPNSYYEVAKRIAKETKNSFYINQYHNVDNSEAHYKITAPELYKQLAENKINLDAIFIGIGTAGTISGIGRFFKEKKSPIKIIGVDTEGSILEHHFRTGEISNDARLYAVEGIGEDMIPQNLNWKFIDDVIKVDDLESFEMARNLARQDGIFAGGSSGSAVAAAVKYCKKHNLKNWQSLVMMPDHASRYISKIYSDEWFEKFKTNFKK